MYGIKGAKYTMSQPMWENANRLPTDGIALARKRVASDVLLQERLRAKLLDLGKRDNLVDLAGYAAVAARIDGRAAGDE
jgi:hypothetical protein